MGLHDRAQRRQTIRFVAAAAILLAGIASIGEDISFAIDESSNIMREEHFGIVDGRITAGIHYNTMGEIDGLFAPPYVSSDFRLMLRLFGSPVPTIRYTWLPYRVTQTGLIGGLDVTVDTVLLYGDRTMLWSLRIRNLSDGAQVVPVEIGVSGTLDRVLTWEFARPGSSSETVAEGLAPGVLALRQGADAVVIASSSPGFVWSTDERAGSITLDLPRGEEAELDLIVSVGEFAQAQAAAVDASRDARASRTRAEAAYSGLVDGLYERLPRFESDNNALVALYNRSLMHLVTSRWEVPEFALRPYYSTGSIRGGCVCNYLWNFGENWEIFPLYDPDAAKTHIKQFLKIDLTKHFAFLPVTGEGFGPWYPVNQEKIIGLIYYYVLHTGDTAFLHETVNDTSILAHVVAQALARDNPDAPVELIDYGPSNSHLELRRGIPYNHVMPDLNGRRYANYLRAAALADLGGKPEPALRDRAEQLKKQLHEELWDPDKNWFAFKNDQGGKSIRYTVQMFKLFGSGVLGKESESGLLAHLNDNAFLSAYGLHSMSKRDIAYDQIDIDNGGGGICTCFPPQIMERLYRDGYAAKADEILGRILWWGDRLPYWGDSLEANRMDYRRDTPLQCTFDGASVAQCIIFGMFGVQVDPDGSIRIRSHRPEFANRMSLTGLKLRGSTIEIEVSESAVQVTFDGEIRKTPPGEEIVLRTAVACSSF